MTRETLKAEYYNRITDAPSLSKMELAELVCEQLDLIFDELENRTCESCRYYTQSMCIHENKIVYDCESSFGCNNWGAKDDK